MAAPRMNPTGMLEVTSVSRVDGKLEVFGYGQRDDIPNPGDLMIVSNGGLSEGFNRETVEFILRIRGRDIKIFADAAATALQLWDENKHWLQAPSSFPDTMNLRTARSVDSQNVVNAFMKLK
tara:strand:+ start:499 stop:864 length:366 start_codon:yes stop_codon:yes gene_type:complete